MRRAMYLSAFAIALTAVGYLGFAPRGAGATPEQASASAQANEAQQVMQQRYTLAYTHEVRVDGNVVDDMVVKGTWTREDDGIGRVSVILGDVEVSGRDVPAAEEIRDRFEIARDSSNRLDRLGFSGHTSPKARGLSTALACVFWYTPGEGDSWLVEEQDRTGRYTAVYTRSGANEVVRTRKEFTAIRGPKGLDAAKAADVSTSGQARFRFDEEGLVEVLVDEEIRMRMGEGLPTLVAHVEATLRRVSSQAAPVRHDEPFALEAIRGYDQDQGSSQRDFDLAELGDAGVAEVLAKLAAVGPLPRRSDAEAAWRQDAFLTTRALLRVKPETTTEIVQALRDNVDSGGDRRVMSVLAGALGEAGTAEADAAMLDLLASDLPGTVKNHVVVAMATSETPSVESMAALKGALDDPEIGKTSALALGVQAGKLTSAAPDTASAAVSELIARYTQAPTDEARLVYLEALANSGAREVFPVIRAALASPHAGLSQAAAYGLRFIPGADVDELLAKLLDGSQSQAVTVQAIRAIAYRTPSAWQGPLAMARVRFEENKVICEAIDKVLSRWTS